MSEVILKGLEMSEKIYQDVWTCLTVHKSST